MRFKGLWSMGGPDPWTITNLNPVKELGCCNLVSQRVDGVKSYISYDAILSIVSLELMTNFTLVTYCEI